MSKKLYTVVIIGPPIAQEAVSLLSRSCRVEYAEATVPEDEVIHKVGSCQADALIVRMGKASGDVIRASSKLRIIAKHGIGVDNIDVAAATAADIPVLITPKANYESVAEHTLGLMLAAARGIPRLDYRVRQGYWDKVAYRGVELFRKTLGIVGFGRIGRRLQELVVPFQMKVVIYDPLLNTETLPPDIIRVDDIHELLKIADFVSINCPLNQTTRRLIGEKELKIMKKSAWIINTSRGGIIDEADLLAALETDEIQGAAIDTFMEEPPAGIPLLGRTRMTVLTPHIGGVTQESSIRMGMQAAENVLRFLESEEVDPDCVVNRDILKSLKVVQH
ncbi:MAG: hydroxyacid dehydrogenase, partial [Desulfobacterales bacterium]